jgi:hypothetical protein
VFDYMMPRMMKQPESRAVSRPREVIWVIALDLTCLRFVNEQQHATMTTSKETAAGTLSLLEARLKRLQFVLLGSSDTEEFQKSTQHNGSAAGRLRDLERSLQTLSAKSPAVSDVLALQKKHPELLNAGASDAPSTLSAASLASLVLAHAQLYQSMSARLTQLEDTSVPDPSSLAKLIELQPRIDQARIRQDAQAKEVAALRARSAIAVEAWYESGVLGMDEQWASWEGRLREAEILVRRREAGKKREDGFVWTGVPIAKKPSK